MQIVIEIDEEYYHFIKRQVAHGITNPLKILIVNGTPLPNGHGRLIDADELYDGFIDGTEGYDCQTWNRIEIGDIIEGAPTIIEADEAESEDKE